MHYFIDGYNLLFRTGSKKSSLQQKRQEILQSLNLQAKSFNLHLTVVFDGESDQIPEPLCSHFDALAVIYTAKGQSADEYILRELKYASHPNKETVITSDRSLAERCHLLGAQTQSIESFLAAMKKKKHKQQSRARSEIVAQDSEREIKRLLQIFEKKWREEEEF